MKYGTQRRTKRIFMIPTSFGLKTNYKLQKLSLTIHCSKKTKSTIGPQTTNCNLTQFLGNPSQIKKGMHKNFILVYKELNYISHRLLSMMHNVTMLKHLPPSP
jgi:hypothetical protein